MYVKYKYYFLGSLDVEGIFLASQYLNFEYKTHNSWPSYCRWDMIKFWKWLVEWYLPYT